MKNQNVFTACNGIKQGGIISPILFNLYIDILLNRLHQKELDVI
jgi:retron-type reverse transcriptase